MVTVASAQESKKQAKDNNNNNSNMNLNKNEIDNRYTDSCDHRHNVDQVQEYYINKYAYENKDYDEDENKEYNNEENEDYNGDCDTFQGACIDLKGSIFDVGQSLKWKETIEFICIYAGKHYTPCVQKSIEGMRDMSHLYIIEPTQATPVSGTAITRVQQIIFEQKVKSYVKRLEDHEDNMAEMFNVIHGQCTKEFID